MRDHLGRVGSRQDCRGQVHHELHFEDLRRRAQSAGERREHCILPILGFRIGQVKRFRHHDQRRVSLSSATERAITLR